MPDSFTMIINPGSTSTLRVKCAALICGENWELVIPVKVNGSQAYTGPVTYSAEGATQLEAETQPTSMYSHPLPWLQFTHWEKEGGEKVNSPTVNLPAWTGNQTWWANYKEVKQAA